MNKNNINNITLNDVNFYYSFSKEKVDNFLKDKNLNEEQYKEVFNSLIQSTVKYEIKDKDFKKKINSLREIEELNK